MDFGEVENLNFSVNWELFNQSGTGFKCDLGLRRTGKNKLFFTQKLTKVG